MLAWLAKCLIINRSPGKKPTATERASEIRKVERAQVESHNVEPTFSFILIQLYRDGQLAQYQEKALSETCHRTYYPSCLHQRFPRCELWKPSIFVGLGGLLTGGGRRDRSDGIFRLLRSGLRLDGRERGRGCGPPPPAPTGPPRALLPPSLSQTSNLSVIFSSSNPGQYGQQERQAKRGRGQCMDVSGGPPGVA